MMNRVFDREHTRRAHGWHAQRKSSSRCHRQGKAARGQMGGERANWDHRIDCEQATGVMILWLLGAHTRGQINTVFDNV